MTSSVFARALSLEPEKREKAMSDDPRHSAKTRIPSTPLVEGRHRYDALKLSYDFEAREGKVRFTANKFRGPKTAIGMFKHIDPNVTGIEVTLWPEETAFCRRNDGRGYEEEWWTIFRNGHFVDEIQWP